MTGAWVEVLRARVAKKGARQAAIEVGYSQAVISQVLGGKYTGNLDAVLRRIERLYGNEEVACPDGEATTPEACAIKRERAGRMGLKAGNPDTLRQNSTCLKCDLRRA